MSDEHVKCLKFSKVLDNYEIDNEYCNTCLENAQKGITLNEILREEQKQSSEHFIKLPQTEELQEIINNAVGKKPKVYGLELKIKVVE